MLFQLDKYLPFEGHTKMVARRVTYESVSFSLSLYCKSPFFYEENTQI